MYSIKINLILYIIISIISINQIHGYRFQYIIQNDCPSQFQYLESTLVKSDCDVPFSGDVAYTIPDDGTGDRSAPIPANRAGRCGADFTLFEYGVSAFDNTVVLFLDISNIDAFSAGLNVTGYYQDGSIKNIHCCSGCPNTTESPNCYGTGNYWFPTEIAGYGTAGWSVDGLNQLIIQWSCLSNDDLGACNNIKCLNDGVCMGGMRAPDGVSGLCLCQPGYEGTRCEVKTDYTPCYGVNCGLFGVCNATTASAGGNKCTCLDGYTGELCTNPPKDSSCYNVDCGPRSICVDGKCQCQAGSSGCGCSTLGNCTIIENLDYLGNDLPSGTFTVKSAEECCSKCQVTPLCYAFTFSGDQCYLKSSVPANNGTSSNGKYSGYLPKTTVTTDACDRPNSSFSIKQSLSTTIYIISFVLLLLSILN